MENVEQDGRMNRIKNKIMIFYPVILFIYFCTTCFQSASDNNLSTLIDGF